MPVGLGNTHNARYSVLTTAGTYTLNQGPGAPGQGVSGQGPPGALYGAYVSTYGTSPVFSAYEFLYNSGTSTTTNLLLNGTGTAVNQSFLPLSGGVIGVRYNGALVVVVTGTANALNVLWD